MRRRSQVVRQRSAKPSSAGSIPAVASIQTPPGFHFTATVLSHGWRHLAPFRWVPEEGVLYRKERLGNRTAELAISFRDGALRIAGAGPSEELTRRMTRMFQLDVDLSEFVALTRDSPAHAWVERAGFGRLLCGSTVWEDAVKVICTTNTTWQQTVRMVGLLVDKCGRGGAFPSPADVARFSAEEVKEDCRLGYRAKSIRMLAECDVPEDVELADYLKLPGIGPYGAAHLLAMDGRHDFIAVDTEFRRFVRETYQRGRKVSDAAMLRRYARWGRWKYLAYWSELVAEALQPVQREDK